MKEEQAGKENNFARRLKFARYNTGWTQEKLGKKVKVPTSSIAQFETNARKPSFDTLKNLAVALNISADYLLGIVDELTIATPARFAKKLERISVDDRVLLDEFIELLIKRNRGVE